MKGLRQIARGVDGSVPIGLSCAWPAPADLIGIPARHLASLPRNTARSNRTGSRGVVACATLSMGEVGTTQYVISRLEVQHFSRACPLPTYRYSGMEHPGLGYR